jgi:antitoxin component YwqK of YwqJK toxin-antitoxin module
MKKYKILLCVVATISIFSFKSFAQTDSSFYTTDKKPLLDSNAKKKGLLGGRLSNEGGPNIEDVKEKYEDLKDKKDKFKSETLPDLGLKVNKAKKIVTDAIKARKANTEYEGIKMEKRIATFGNGNRQTTEEFFILKEDIAPSIYNRELRWYDYKMQRTSTNQVKDINEVDILHGPYKKFIGEELVEEGFFYLGAKDGRWERYGKEFDADIVLLDKQKYWHGFAADSKITFYDDAKTKIKEVIPVHYGKVTGQYASYYISGNLKEEGNFDDSTKVGKWIEYYEFGTSGRRKKESIFQKDKFDMAFEPFVLREYDSKGKLNFENKEAIKQMEAEKEN